MIRIKVLSLSLSLSLTDFRANAFYTLRVR